MTCTCGHTEEQHHPVSGKCMVCECEKFKEPYQYTPGFYDE